MFWEKICKEHNLSADGQSSAVDRSSEEDRLSVYFIRASDERYVPRSICVDLENGTLDQIANSPIGPLFNPDNFVAGAAGAGNNFAKGFYTEGSEYLEEVMEKIRKEVENCNCLQGFQLTHSCGGGTGSGMGSRIVAEIRQDYSNDMICTFTIFPSEKASDVVVEPYNALLSLFHLEETNATFTLDNQALYDICKTHQKIERPSYDDLNRVVSEAICGITACVRFPSQLNSDMRKLAVNLVPFPRLHYFVSSYAPLSSSINQQYRTMSVKDVSLQMFDSKNMMADCDIKSGRYFSVATLFRGSVSTKEVEDNVNALQRKHESNFIPWIPNNVLTACCNVPPVGTSIGGTFIGNTTAIAGLHSRILTQANRMLEKKAFLHWYTDEGMCVEEINEAANSLKDLICEYKSHESETADDDTLARSD